MKRNIDLVKRYKNGEALTKLKYRDKPADRLMLLGDLARLRLIGQSETALNLLERYVKTNSLEDWVHGGVVTALLHLDEGRVLTATSIAEKLAKQQSRHPI